MIQRVANNYKHLSSSIKEIEGKDLKFFLLMIFSFVCFRAFSDADFGSAATGFNKFSARIKLITYQNCRIMVHVHVRNA